MKQILLLSSLIVSIIACKKNDSLIVHPTAPRPPIVNVIPHQTILLPIDTALLDGSASTGKIVEWHWSKLTGPSSSVIINADSAKAIARNLVNGNYVFELKVKDDKGLVASNMIKIDIGHLPVAKAGADTTITVASCGATPGQISLDGTGSYDLDNDIFLYRWKQISGSKQIVFSTPLFAKTLVNDLTVGQYEIELTITDSVGFISKDTIQVNIATPIQPEGFDLDFVVEGDFIFVDNEEICPWDCYSIDEFSMNASGTASWLGNMNISINEQYDTTSQSFGALSSSTSFRLSNSAFATCYSDFGFKKLIQQGGGTFNNTIQLTSGSAQTCNQNIFTNLPPLTITGSLDVSRQHIIMHIKGKIFF